VATTSAKCGVLGIDLAGNKFSISIKVMLQTVNLRKVGQYHHGEQK